MYAADAMPVFQLKPRFLTEDDRALVARFSAGEEDPWSREVTHHFQNHAMEDAGLGLRRTILFSFRDCQDIAGCLTVSASALQLSPAVAADIACPTRKERVPIVLLSWFGVAPQHWGHGVGQEMHLHLLKALEESWIASRLIYLECWEANERALRFWRQLGYVEIGREDKAGPQGAGMTALLRMVYDRFALFDS
jgi:ribosomal protein S18 acetylase RimI-like enzyme